MGIFSGNNKPEQPAIGIGSHLSGFFHKSEESDEQGGNSRERCKIGGKVHVSRIASPKRFRSSGPYLAASRATLGYHVNSAPVCSADKTYEKPFG